jgi:hypothetical protein
MPNPIESKRYDWLTMIFMGADNDLHQFGETLLEEVQRVGSTDRVAVVVERDPTKQRLPTERGLVMPGRWMKESIGVTNGGAEAVLDFVHTTGRDYPADKKMLMLWDHGNGWQNSQVFQKVVKLPADLETLALIDAVGGNDVDVLCFDACLMAMIEIAYQLRRRVRYLVASENVIPADKGWPHEAILSSLTARPDMSAADAARMIVSTFSGSYNTSDEPVTLSAFDLQYAEETVEAISVLSRALIMACRNGGRGNVLMARRLCQSFGNPDYIDLVSFCDELRKAMPGTAVDRAAAGVRESVARLVMSFCRSSALSIRGANGVSIYYPDRPVSPLYEQLDFTSHSGWGTFLDMVVPHHEPERKVPPPQHQGTLLDAGMVECAQGHVSRCPECARSRKKRVA